MSYEPLSTDYGADYTSIYSADDITDLTEVRSVQRGLMPNSRYVARVRSINKLGVASAWSEPLEFATSSDTTRPKAPTSLSVDFAGPNLSLSWAAVTQNTDNSAINDLAFYEVLLANDLNGSVGPFRFTTPSTSFSFLWDQNNALNTSNPSYSYSVEVRAVDFSGNKSDPVIANAENTPPSTPGSAPSVVRVGSSLRITLPYGTAATDIKSYTLLFEKDASSYTKSGVLTETYFFPYFTEVPWASPTDEVSIKYKAVDMFDQESAYSAAVVFDVATPSEGIDEVEITPGGIGSITVVQDATLTTPRPAEAIVVYWIFNDPYVDPGTAGQNIVNLGPGDLWYVPPIPATP